ncbi:hypothetical protein F2P56_035538 [Juglans regia]|uniref:procollagen-proline 3-dioxygenase n=2 Tax=Juglans regia TaxID=51240 RepID=A0A833WTN5_JUGRE|nr:uncharacterized protein LOC108987189 [Juglans regia]KAF5442931.1 hypothetical protein F2P56_035538 [Juglans regia]
MAEAKQKHPRLILRNFLTLFQCKELEFIHKSNSTVGYRPNVFSTTLSHLIATNSPHLVMPFVPIRESLKEKVEEFFGCEYELFVEFTGLISWCRGASIGWHSDDNRPYLKQRAFAAVCYLNSFGKDFKGGHFHFQDGEPRTIEPLAGDVVMYTADGHNIHSVDEIIGGERLTLTLWFSRDASHDEDAKLVSLLSQRLLHNNVPGPCLPLLASSNMYWFSLDQISHRQLGFDICWARLHVLGFDVYSYQDRSCDSDLSELLAMPLQLARGIELFNVEFVNILHALQVAQFYYWKASTMHTSKVQIDHGKVGVLSQSQMEKINRLKSVLSKDHQQAEMFFSCMISNESRQYMFDWADFASTVAAWEDYSSKLHEEFLRSLPYWRTHQSIFEVQSNGSF